MTYQQTQPLTTNHVFYTALQGHGTFDVFTREWLLMRTGLDHEVFDREFSRAVNLRHFQRCQSVLVQGQSAFQKGPNFSTNG